jgi:hypothetical protein
MMASPMVNERGASAAGKMDFKKAEETVVVPAMTAVWLSDVKPSMIRVTPKGGGSGNLKVAPMAIVVAL